MGRTDGDFCPRDMCYFSGLTFSLVGIPEPKGPSNFDSLKKSDLCYPQNWVLAWYFLKLLEENQLDFRDLHENCHIKFLL